MNQPYVDYLFQVTLPVPDRAASSPARDGRVPDFGNHLADAAATTTGKLPLVPNYQSPGYQLDSSPTAAEPAGRGGQQFDEPTSEILSADDSLDAGGTSETVQSGPRSDLPAETTTDNSGNAAGQTDEDFTATPDSLDATSDDEAIDEAADAGSVVATVAPAAAAAVADQLACAGDEVAAESISVGQPRKKMAPDDAASLLPNERAQGPETLSSSAPLATAEPPALAAPGADENALNSLPVRDSSDGKLGTSSADTKKSKRPERGDKRSAAEAANGDQTSQTVAKASDDGQRLSEAVAAVEAMASERSADHPQDSRLDGSSNNANTKSNTPTAKGPATAVANAATVQPVVDASNANSADDSNANVVKTDRPAKQDAIVGTARMTRTTLAGRRTGKAAADADEAPRIDPTRFVGRVAKAIQTAHERGSTLQLRLSPPELGAVKLALTVKDGVLTAALETETASARRLLLDHLPALRERLAGQNIRIERFDVDVQRENTGGRPDSHASHHRQQQHDQPRSQSLPHRSTTQPAIVDQPTMPISIAGPNSQGINVMA